MAVKYSYAHLILYKLTLFLCISLILLYFYFQTFLGKKNHCDLSTALDYCKDPSHSILTGKCGMYGIDSSRMPKPCLIILNVYFTLVQHFFFQTFCLICCLPKGGLLKLSLKGNELW